MVGLQAYLLVSAVLFVIGMTGVLIRRNILVVFMSVELMLNAANLALIAFARFLGLMDGHVLAFFVIALAASEAAVGLAVLVALYRNKETVDLEHIRLMKW